MSRRTRLDRVKIPKDYRPLVRAAVDAGWEFTKNSRAPHAKLVAPDGFELPVPGTSGSRALLKSFRCRLRAHGVTV